MIWEGRFLCAFDAVLIAGDKAVDRGGYAAAVRGSRVDVLFDPEAHDALLDMATDWARHEVFA